MICNKHGYVGDKKCIRYWGEHEELRDMLKKGDIVTLLWQNEDKSESIKITGTVTHCGLDSIDVRTSYDEEEYVLDNPNVLARRKYTVTNIKRLVKNMLPDSPGPWYDKNLDTWIVNDDLNAIRVSYDGEWLLSGGIMLPSEYAEYAPFTKINVIEEKA
mgnify:CR=1 FL=1